MTRRLEQLRRRVQTATGVDAAALYELFREETGSDDVERFAHYLWEQQVIDAELLAALLAESERDGPPDRSTEAAAATSVESGVVARQPSGSTEEGAALAAGAAQDGTRAGTRSDRYELLEPLGKGAMGEVFVARDVALRRKVAFKTLLPEAAVRSEVRERFVDEVRITSQLDHPGIVPVYGLEATGDGRVAYAMKWVQGRELGDLLDAARAALGRGEALPDELSRPQRIEHLVKVCDAIAFAHSRGLIHRDLKPANIMLGRFGEVYVMDWGIARLMGGGDDPEQSELDLAEADRPTSSAERTRVGRAIGTPVTMSPEQARGENAQLDGRSDIYALGLVLQQVATLERAVAGTTLDDVMAHAKQGRRVEPVAHRGEAPLERELRAIIDKATRPEREERYADASALADDLRRFLRGEAVLAAPDTTLQRFGRWLARHRMAALGIMVLLVVVGVASTVAVGSLLQERRVIREVHREEAAVAAFLTESSQAAHRLDAELHRIEAMSEHVAGAAKQALDPAAESEPPPQSSRRVDLGAGAARVPSKAYGGPIGVREPAYALAPGTDPTSAEASLQRLGSLAPTLRHALLEAVSPRYEAWSVDAQQKRIAEGAGTVHRVFVTLDDGAHVAFPAGTGYPDRFDARRELAYERAVDAVEPAWSGPYEGRAGDGRLLACSVAIRADDGSLLGVVGLEVALDRLLARYLGAPAGAKVLLADASGTAILGGPLERDSAAREAIRQAIVAKKTGLVTIGPEPSPRKASRALAYAAISPVEATDWLHVVVVDSGALVGSAP